MVRRFGRQILEIRSIEIDAIKVLQIGIIKGTAASGNWGHDAVL